jgi:hypothetical protein
MSWCSSSAVDADASGVADSPHSGPALETSRERNPFALRGEDGATIAHGNDASIIRFAPGAVACAMRTTNDARPLQLLPREPVEEEDRHRNRRDADIRFREP